MRLTKKGKKITADGVTILGYTDLPSRLATQSSRLYGNNLVKLVKLLGDAKEFTINQEDEIIRGSLVLDEGKLTWPPQRIECACNPKRSKENPDKQYVEEKKSIFSPGLMLGLLSLVCLLWDGKEKMNFLIS